MNSSAARMPSVTGRQLLPIGGVMNTVRKTLNWIVASLLLVLCIPGTLPAATGTWTGGAGATWDTTAGNWSGVSGTPWDSSNGANNIADFNTAGATPAVSGTVYVNGIVFDNTATISGGTAITLAGASPTITANANGTNNTALNGTPGFTKLGTGIFAIGTSATYNGGTITVNNGTLSFLPSNGDGINPSTTHSIVINNGGTLANIGGNNINNDVTLTINSGGTYNSQAADSIGGITGSGTVTGNISVITLNLPSNLTFDGLLTGAARLQVQNNSSLTTAGTPRTFTLTNPNNNNTANNLMAIGGDSADVGNKGDCTLKLGASEVITDNIVLRLNGNKAASGAGSYQNALDMNGCNETIAGLTYGAVQATGTKPGLVTNSAATTSTLTLNVASAMSTNFYGIIAGNIALTKAGIYTQALYGANTYTGNTTISAGTLVVSSPGSLGASAVTVASGAVLGGSGTVNGNVTVASGGTLNGTGPFNGTVTVASGGTLIAAPGGANAYGSTTFGNDLTLNGNAQFSLDLNADTTAGTTYDQVAITGNLVLNGASTIILNFPSGTAAVGTYTLMTYAAKSGSGSLTLDKAYPNATLTVGATSVTLTVSGSSTYVSGDVWKGGVSAVWDTSALNWTRNGAASQAYVAGDAVTFDDTASGNFSTISGTNSPASVTFNNNANAYTVSAVITGAVTAVTKNGAANTTLSGASTYGGGTVVNSGTLTLGVSSSTSGGVVTNGPTGTGNVTLNGGTINVTGNTTWYMPQLNLAGNIAYVGGGYLRLGANTNDLGSTTRTLMLNGSATLVTGGNTITTFNSQIQINAGPNGLAPVFQNGVLDLETTTLNGANYAAFVIIKTPTWNNATLTVGQNVLLDMSSNQALGGPALTINTGGIWNMDNNNGAVAQSVASLSGGGNIFSGMKATDTTAHTLTINGTSGNTTFSGIISDGPGTGALSLSKTGGSTQTLSGASTYSGGTTHSSGTIAVGGNQALGTGPVVIAGGALAAASGGGTLSNVINMVSNAIFDTTSGSLTLAGSITNRGAITKTGANALIINGTLADTNTLTVSAGILAGTGTLAGTVSNSAAIMAGPDTNTVGTLTVSNLVMNSGSSYNWKYNASSYDTITANGTLTLPAVATVNVSRVSGTTTPPNPAVLFSAASAPTINGATTLSGWVINGALPSTKVRVVGNQVIMTSSKGCVFYVN